LTRELRDSDIPKLRRLYDKAGYTYGFPDLRAMEDVVVLADENDEPIGAAIAKLIPELSLMLDPSGHPLVKMQRIGELHAAMAAKLTAKGYHEGTAFLAPELAKSYGRHLRKWFGWVKTNPGYMIRG
jgi:hypothetical protein